MTSPGRVATRLALGAGTVLYLALVLWVTLGPVPWDVRSAQDPLGVLDPAAWLSRDTWTAGSRVEFVANIAMFVPLGLLFALQLGPVARILVPLALTAAIEVAQIPLTDRVSDPRDLVANGVGALAGVLLVAVARALARPRPAPRTSPRAAPPPATMH